MSYHATNSAIVTEENDGEMSWGILPPCAFFSQLTPMDNIYGFGLEMLVKDKGKSNWQRKYQSANLDG